MGVALRAIWRNKGISEVMRGMYKAIVVPTLMYESEPWKMNAREGSWVEAMEIRCLKAIQGVTK